MKINPEDVNLLDYRNVSIFMSPHNQHTYEKSCGKKEVCNAKNLTDFLKDRITVSLRDYLNGINNDLIYV